MENVSWDTAKARCEAMGGHLAVIHNQAEFDQVLLHMERLGFENGFYQDPSAAGEEMIPDFDLTGV